MKKITKYALIIAIIFFLVPLMVFLGLKGITLKAVQEGSAEIIFNKQEFFPYETIQIQIIGDFIKPIVPANIKVKKDSLIMPVQFYVEKISANSYFAYAILGLSPGSYNISIAAEFPFGTKLFEREIKINEVSNQYYESLFSMIKDKWFALGNRDLIYGLQAIQGMDKAQDDKAMDELIKRIETFSDIEKALALIIINSSDELWRQKKVKLLNYFLAMQDNAVGTFKVNIKPSIDVECKIGSIKERISAGSEKFVIVNFLNASMLELEFYCYKLLGEERINASSDDIRKINANLSKEYFSYKKFYEFNKSLEESEGNIGIKFSLAKEFGAVKDDVLLTSLVLIAFINNNINYGPIYWLKKQDEGLIKNIALAYLNDVDAINYLLSRQEVSGRLPYESIFSAAEVSCLAYAYATIPTNSLLYNWIKDNIDGFSIKDKAACLSLALKKQNIINVLPGIIKTTAGSSFDIYIGNKGISDTLVEIRNVILNLNYTTEIKKDQTKKITVNVPSISFAQDYVEDKIGVYYFIGSYSIPIIIFIQQNVTNITTVKNITISETETLEIEINQTKEGISETKKLIDIFKTEPEKVEINLTKQSQISLKLKNVGSKKISNIIVWSSASLFEVVKSIQPSIINELDVNEEKEIIVVFEKGALPSYEGTITIEGMVEGSNYKKEVPVKLIGAAQVTAGTGAAALPSCEQLNGTLCKANEKCEGSLKSSREGSCCVGKCKKKSKALFGVIFILIGIIILTAAIIVLKRKPKTKKIEEIIKRIEEKQREKGIQI